MIPQCRITPQVQVRLTQVSPQCRILTLVNSSQGRFPHNVGFHVSFILNDLRFYVVGKFPNFTYLIEILPHKVGYLQQIYSPLCRMYKFSERTYVVGKCPDFTYLIEILPHTVGLLQQNLFPTMQDIHISGKILHCGEVSEFHLSN